MITIRPATAADADAMLVVHVASIREVCGRHYDPAQIEAWAGPKKADRYLDAMRTGTVLVAEDDGAIVGFGDLGRRGSVRALYLRPDRIGAGIGHRLLDALEADARARGITRLEVHSSINAISFYERAGFVREGPEQFELRGAAPLDAERLSKTLDG